MTISFVVVFLAVFVVQNRLYRQYSTLEKTVTAMRHKEVERLKKNKGDHNMPERKPLSVEGLPMHLVFSDILSQVPKEMRVVKLTYAHSTHSLVIEGYTQDSNALGLFWRHIQSSSYCLHGGWEVRRQQAGYGVNIHCKAS